MSSSLTDNGIRQINEVSSNVPRMSYQTHSVQRVSSLFNYPSLSWLPGRLTPRDQKMLLTLTSKVVTLSDAITSSMKMQWRQCLILMRWYIQLSVRDFVWN